MSDWADEKAQDIVSGSESYWIAIALREAEAKGRRDGIEAAAKWHDEQADALARGANVIGVGGHADAARASARRHREDATALRALSEEGRDA